MAVNLGQQARNLLGFDITPGFNLSDTAGGRTGKVGVTASGTTNLFNTGNQVANGGFDIPTGATGPIQNDLDLSKVVRTGAYGGDGGPGAGGTDSALKLAQMADQEGLLRSYLGNLGNTLNQGVSQINDDFTRQNSRGQEDKAAAFGKFDMQTEDNNRNKSNQMNQVNQNANTLSKQVRQTIGRASGSGSSAYQLTAPGAVANEVTDQREDVQDTFAGNFRQLKVARDDTDREFSRYFDDLNRSKAEKEKGLREGVEQENMDVQGKLADIARNRAAIQGGDVNAIRAAGQPYQADIANRQNTINSLFEKYRSPIQAQAARVAAPSLADYAGRDVGVSRQQVLASDPTNPLLRRSEEDDERLY